MIVARSRRQAVSRRGLTQMMRAVQERSLRQPGRRRDRAVGQAQRRVSRRVLPPFFSEQENPDPLTILLSTNQWQCRHGDQQCLGPTWRRGTERRRVPFMIN